MKPAPANCCRLEWDSEFFGFPIARLDDPTPSAEAIASVLQWAAEDGIACLYFEAPAGSTETIRLAEQNGFQLVDVRLVLSLETLDRAKDTAADTSITVRSMAERDLEPLKEIAGTVFTNTRYYADQGFSRARCAELYRVWLEKSYRDREQHVLVAETQGRPAGFVTLQVESDTGRIGLFGAAADAQGKGLGQALLADAASWFTGKGLKRVVTVTQGRSVAAQRVYQRAGFVTDRVSLYYHRWFRASCGER